MPSSPVPAGRTCPYCRAERPPTGGGYCNGACERAAGLHRTAEDRLLEQVASLQAERDAAIEKIGDLQETLIQETTGIFLWNVRLKALTDRAEAERERGDKWLKKAWDNQIRARKSERQRDELVEALKGIQNSVWETEWEPQRRLSAILSLSEEALAPYSEEREA